MSGTQLPKFADPPVVEVALSISFEPLDRFRSAHAGRLWERLKEQFPVTEDQPELPSPVEEPGRPAPGRLPRVEFIERPRVRTWFYAEDQTQLLQVQYNRIAYNWKRGSVSQPYPSYDAVEGRFRELVPIITDFLTRERLGEIVPNQAEITYVNHIREPHGNVGRILTLWCASAGGFLPPIEDVRFAARYVIPDDSRNMIGRLVVDLQPAYITNTREEILKLDLTARGKPRSADIDGALAFLRIGHEWIVNGFAEMTTPEMQTKWRRTQ